MDAVTKIGSTVEGVPVAATVFVSNSSWQGNIAGALVDIRGSVTVNGSEFSGVRTASTATGVQCAAVQYCKAFAYKQRVL